jgi:hypothetical protein
MDMDREEYINAGCIHIEGRINKEAMDEPMDILCMLIHCESLVLPRLGVDLLNKMAIVSLINLLKF